MTTPAVLFAAVMRWNGMIGFPGGMVEPRETLHQCAARECMEEINYRVDVEKLKLFCSHKVNNNFNTHLFLYKLTPEEIYELQAQSGKAEHARLEGSGVIVYHSTKDSRANILMTPAAKTVREELELLIEEGLI